MNEPMTSEKELYKCSLSERGGGRMIVGLFHHTDRPNLERNFRAKLLLYGEH